MCCREACRKCSCLAVWAGKICETARRKAGKTPSAPKLLAPRTWLNHATAPARFSYRINIPNPTRAAPAIDLVPRKFLLNLVISASSGLFFLALLTSRTRSRKIDRTVNVFAISHERQASWRHCYQGNGKDPPSCYRLLMLRQIGFCLALFCAFVCCGFANAKDKYEQPRPIHLDRAGERWAEQTLHKLSTEEKVGQLFVVWVRAKFLNVEAPEYLQLRDDIRKYHLGGLTMTVPWDPPFLYRSQPYEAAEILNRLQQDSKLPLLIAADFERGVSMRLHGATEFPHAMAFGAAGKLDHAEAFGRITAQEARAIGVHWNFFPDADVNSNPANPIINTRRPRQRNDDYGQTLSRPRRHRNRLSSRRGPGDWRYGAPQVRGTSAVSAGN